MENRTCYQSHILFDVSYCSSITALGLILIIYPIATELPAVIVGERDILASIPTYEQPAKKPETTIDLLLRLDCWVQPGLTEDQFKGLFVKCRCGVVTTRRAFIHHMCAKIPSQTPQAPRAVTNFSMID